jgi:hypothetical protein
MPSSLSLTLTGCVLACLLFLGCTVSTASGYVSLQVWSDVNCTVPLSLPSPITEPSIAASSNNFTCVPYTTVNSINDQSPPQWLSTVNCDPDPSSPTDSLVSVYYYSINGVCPSLASDDFYPANLTFLLTNDAGQCTRTQFVMRNATANRAQTAYLTTWCNNRTLTTSSASAVITVTRPLLTDTRTILTLICVIATLAYHTLGLSFSPL